MREASWCCGGGYVRQRRAPRVRWAVVRKLIHRIARATPHAAHEEALALQKKGRPLAGPFQSPSSGEVPARTPSPMRTAPTRIAAESIYVGINGRRVDGVLFHDHRPGCDDYRPADNHSFRHDRSRTRHHDRRRCLSIFIHFALFVPRWRKVSSEPRRSNSNSRCARKSQHYCTHGVCSSFCAALTSTKRQNSAISSIIVRD
jgi:hypothetical protein